MRRAGRRFICVAAAVPLLACLPALSIASASTPAAASAAPNTTIVGSVVRDGTPVAGARLEVSVWPSEPVLAKLKQGDPVPMLNIPGQQTNRSGMFEIDVDWTKVPAAYRDANGTADLQVMADDGIKSVVWNLPAAPAASAKGLGGRASSMAVTGIFPDNLRFDLGSEPGVLDAHAASVTRIGPALRLTSAGMTPVGAATDTASHGALAGSRTTGAAVICYQKTGSTITDLLENYGRIFAWSGVNTVVSETDGNDHSLGLGIKVGNQAWTTDGTASFGESTSNGGSVNNAKDATLNNRVNYTDFYTSCSNGFVSVTRKPTSTYAQLTDFSYAGHANWPYCHLYTTGTFTKSSGTNVTYSYGMDIAVLQVSAQAGWNSSTEIKFTLTAPSNYCGSTSLGPAGAPEAEMNAG
jgi:hypothetical protein